MMKRGRTNETHGVNLTAGRAPGRSQAGPHPLGGSADVFIGRGAPRAGRAPGRSQAGPHPFGGAAAVLGGRGAPFIMLTIKNLYAGYGKVQVLHGISIEVPKGKVVTLIGSNGAGKTTTMRAVSGMIVPSAGEISLNGKRLGGPGL